MDKLKPKLFSVLKHYTLAQFGKDVVAGIIVAVVLATKHSAPKNNNNNNQNNQNNQNNNF